MSDEGLLAAYRGLVCDLDGVVYRGAFAVEHAVAELEAARASAAIVFATNNASRTVAEVTDQLRSAGLSAPLVVTSAEVGAQLIAREIGVDTVVLGVGGAGIVEALAAAGLRRVTRASAKPTAVLQGWAPQVCVADLAQAAIAVRAGAAWFATNTDRTLPTPDGPIPGNGTLVAAVEAATGVLPRVVGKPEPPLYAAAAALMDAPGDALLVVGDRLETDIVGAMRAGLASLWVLTGVDGFASLATSTATPTYAAPDLRALHLPYPAVRPGERVGSWWVGELAVQLDPASTEPFKVLGTSDPVTDASALAAWGVHVVTGLRDGALNDGALDPGLDGGLALRVAAQLDASLAELLKASS